MSRNSIQSFKGQILFSLVFVVVGLAIFIGGLASLIKKTNYPTTTATIDTIYSYYNGDEVTHDVYVTYEIDGKEYKHIQFNTYASSYYEGKELTIKYNPNDPGDISDSSPLFNYGAIFVGLVFALIGIGTIFGAVKHKKNIESMPQPTPENIDDKDVAKPISDYKPNTDSNGAYSPFLSRDAENATLEKQEVVTEESFKEKQVEKPYEGFSGTTEDNKYMKYAGVYKATDDPYKTDDPNSIYNSEVSEYDYNSDNK